jgi:aldehyde:ferredoxin oxidoreductase
VINNRLGLTRENDKLPKGFLVPYEDDESKYVPDFRAMMDEYYRIRGWDEVSGLPGIEKLTELNLEWAMSDLDLLEHDLKEQST